MIHCIGDSHVSIFSGSDSMPFVWNRFVINNVNGNFKYYRIGPATATGLASKIPIIDNIIEYGPIDKEKDNILFCFGEVDIRAHLTEKFILNGENDDIIKFSVDEYFRVVKIYKDKGFNVMIWAPIASFSDEKPYTTGPSYGTCLERNKVTKIFNNYLKELCKSENIEFISIFEEMLLDNGETNPIYLDTWDGCHIHLVNTAYPIVIEKFKSII